ncbi:velvet factor-domain-containing protein [Mycotypha africana]|uniref:velvet factor-domain-containing protein n=1 Tax=Mycotypha africana TaxID=64632 RepID=UPI0023012D3C|nr:velvet factor-domain-containing protein [Mycotypha africana]KAI8968205.1 velvet factor-domain-containing protein [Mycotypha africana]
MDSKPSNTRYEKLNGATSTGGGLNGFFDQLFSFNKTSNGSILPSQYNQTQQRSRFAVTNHRWFRLSLLAYILFSLVLTTAHMSSWLSTLRIRVGDSLVYGRTYDTDQPYSLITNMSHGLKMSKFFAQGHYDTLKNTQPYWQKASQDFASSDVTLITTTTPNTWKDFVDLSKQWKGPISVTLHVAESEKDKVLSNIQTEYKTKPELYKNVDIHVLQAKEKAPSIKVPVNVERNLARLFARTDYVADIPLNIMLASPLHQNLFNNNEKVKNGFTAILDRGDMLVVPTFQYTNANASSKFALPQTKKDLLRLVEKQKVLGLFDKHFQLNEGPTDFEQWKKAESVYPIREYGMDYEPIIIQSKTIQPWCSERFIDNRAACLLQNYLAGYQFFVLPDDYVIQKPHQEQNGPSELDTVIEKRLYAKFYWEQCVYLARQLESLGLWNTERGDHIREQCSRIIENWDTRYNQYKENGNNKQPSDNLFKSIGYDEREKRTYELVVCQQPLHARMCGFGEKDRRPIDPPPIVQLIVRQEGSEIPVDVQTLQIPFFVLHVTLWSDDCREERNIISNPPKCTRVLMGSLVSSPSLLKNPEGEQGLYFAFPDLSIRTEGRYTLRFSLMKLFNSDFQENAKSKIIAQVFSDPFTVYSAKKNQQSYQKPLPSKA